MKKNMKQTTIAFLIFCCIFVFSAIRLTAYFLQSTTEEHAFRELKQFTASAEELPPEVSEATISEASKPTVSESDSNHADRQILPEYAALYEKNPDLWGWIRIDDTSLDYPIMHTPQSPEYYLHRDFEGNDSQAGVPFLSASCYENCGNYIIYGHHMKNGTMFAPLLSYAKKTFYEEHPTISLDTLHEHASYTIVAAFYSQVSSTEDTDAFRYYQYTELTNEELFHEYRDQIKNTALYETNTEIHFGDQLLTLSTCSYHTENGRFVVVAKKD